MTAYIAYVDDSGNENRAVYLALLIPLEHWNVTQQDWLAFRGKLYSALGVPADVELHAAEIAQPGKGKLAPGLTYGVNTDRGKRRKLLELGTAQVGQLEHVRIIAHQDVHITPEKCYNALLKKIDRVLLEEDSWALMVVDGTNTDASHFRAHRQLDPQNRRIIEDPWKQDSALNQMVQMADLAAYTLFQGHELYEGRNFMWGWAKKYLHDREWSGQCCCPS